MAHQTNAPLRLVPEERFPAYAYVPGKFAHPTRNTAGHSAAKDHSVLVPLDPEHWQQCRTYLWGIDLFNHGYYWEAHEAWESLWHAAGRRGALADFLKGLIALAAAGVKAREGRVAGVKQHALRARSMFGGLASQPKIEGRTEFMGLDVRVLIDASEQIAVAPEKILNTVDRSVEIVFGFSLSLVTSAAPRRRDFRIGS